MTFRELFREFVAAMRRRKSDHNRDITLAWSFAALTRGTKGLPKLETLLVGHTPRRQTASEQKTVLRQIADAYGLRLRKKGQPVAPQPPAQAPRARKVIRRG